MMAEKAHRRVSTSACPADKLITATRTGGMRKMGQNHDRTGGHFSSSYSLNDPEDTKAHYKSWAATYDKEVGEDNEYAQPRRCAETLAKNIDPSNTRILDAGCGSGLSGVALNAAGFQNIDGCDFSTEMLALANDKGVYTDLFETDLNAGQPGIANSTYDAVTAVGVFSFGHVSPDACDDLLRIIKPGGYLIIALNEKFWDEGSLATKLDQLEDAQKLQIMSKEYGDHLPGHDVNGWVIVLRKV